MKPTDFSVHVTSFLTHYLAAQRNVSPNTIKAYRDVFTLLLRFCRDVQGIAPERLRLEQIDVSLVEAFLDYLERERKSSPQTRNHRLAALHAFFRYVQAEEPARMHQCQKIRHVDGEIGRFHGSILRGMTSPKAASARAVISGKSSAVRWR